METRNNEFKKFINSNKKIERSIAEYIAEDLFNYYFNKYDFIPRYNFKHQNFSFYFFKTKCVIQFGTQNCEYDLHLQNKYHLTIFRVEELNIEQLLVVIAQIKTLAGEVFHNRKNKNKSKKTWRVKKNLVCKNDSLIKC